MSFEQVQIRVYLHSSLGLVLPALINAQLWLALL
jgi:hypothetical protein